MPNTQVLTKVYLTDKDRIVATGPVTLIIDARCPGGFGVADTSETALWVPLDGEGKPDEFGTSQAPAHFDNERGAYYFNREEVASA